MKKIIKKAIATVASITLILSLFAGIEQPKVVYAGTSVELTPWKFFQTGTTTDEWNGWEVCAYNRVETSEGEIFTSEDFPYGPTTAAGQTPNGTEITVESTKPATGFTADIASNGWTANYETIGGITYITSNNPHTVTAYMENIKLTDGHNYTVSFKCSGSQTKRAKIVVQSGENYLVDETVTAYANAGDLYEFEFDYHGNTPVKVTIMLGCFPFEYNEVNWKGQFYLSDFAIEDNTLGNQTEEPTTVNPNGGSQKPTTEVPTTEVPTTVVPTTVAPSTDNKITPPSRTTVKSASKKKSSKKVKISIKKVKSAKGYKVQFSDSKKFKKTLITKTVAKDTVTITSKKITNIKNLYVRAKAYKLDGTKKIWAKQWSKVKKVKVK